MARYWRHRATGALIVAPDNDTIYTVTCDELTEAQWRAVHRRGIDLFGGDA